MNRTGKRNNLSKEQVRRVLDAIRNARPLPATPLNTFYLLQQRLPESMTIDATLLEYELAQWLNSEIMVGLTRHRVHFSHPTPDINHDREKELANLAVDFQTNSVELEAWSLLYFRYVRIDLDLSWDEIEIVTLQDVRTLRRRINRGIKRLITQLLQHEQQIRKLDHRNALKRSLPCLSNYNLVGRDDEWNQLWQLLTMSERPNQVVLVGPGGIGKTTLANSLAHHLVDEFDLDHIVWLTIPPDTTLRDLSERCTAVLEIPADNDVLRSYCQTHNILFVFDEFENLIQGISNQDLQDFLSHIMEARLIITCRYHITTASLTTVVLTELTSSHAHKVMYHTLEENLPLDPQRQALIQQFAGGNHLPWKLRHHSLHANHNQFWITTRK